MIKVLIINGPNLNMLGKREPEVYGTQTLVEINKQLTDYCRLINVLPQFFQSNNEGEIITKIHSAAEGFDGVIINGGAYSHYSHAIADALDCITCAKIEVHLSNIFARKEEFRHESVLSRAVSGVICGFGADSYRLAVTEIASIAKAKLTPKV